MSTASYPMSTILVMNIHMDTAFPNEVTSLSVKALSYGNYSPPDTDTNTSDLSTNNVTDLTYVAALH